MSNQRREQRMAGTKPLGIYIDEVREMAGYGEAPVVRERLPAEGVVIPPYAQDHQNTHRGDQIVVVSGDQFGWRGTVSSVYGNGAEFTISADMVRLDGSTASRVTHRGSFVGRILKEVPRFDHPEDAEAWLDGQLREPVQEYAVGARVVFSSPPHLAIRLAFRREVEDGRTKREWLERHDDLEAEGRVTRFMPRWEHESKRESAFGAFADPRQTIPGYELLVTLDGEPNLIEVAARRIKRLA